MKEVIPQDQLDSLAAALSAVGGSARHARVQPFHEAALFDFANPARLQPRARIALARLFAAREKPVTAALRQVLHGEAEARWQSLVPMRGDQLRRALRQPTAAGLFRLDAHHRHILLDVDPAVALSIVDLRLGGDGAPPETLRPLSTLEAGLLSEVLQVLAQALVAHLGDAFRANFVRTLDNLSQAALTDEGCSVVCPVFEMTIGSTVGPMTLAIPEDVALAMFDAGAAQPHPSQAPALAAGRRERALWAALLVQPLTARVVLGRLELTLSQLSRLKPGDLLNLAAAADQPVSLCIGDLLRVAACPILDHHGRLAVRLEERPVPPDLKGRETR